MTTPAKQKSSTLTLRLTSEETAQLEHLKQLTGRTTGSDLIKYLISNHERMLEQYHEAIKLHTAEARKLAEAHQALNNYFEAYERLKALQLIECRANSRNGIIIEKTLVISQFFLFFPMRKYHSVL